MNLHQSEKLIAEIKDWYIAEIQRAAAESGGLSALALSLGYSEKYLWRLLDRSSFSALRRVVKKIHSTKN